MTIVFQATWTVRPGKTDEAIAVLRELTASSRREPGNLAYEPYADPADPLLLRILEVYTDEAAVTAHEESAHFAAFRERADELLSARRRDFFVPIDSARP